MSTIHNHKRQIQNSDYIHRHYRLLSCNNAHWVLFFNHWLITWEWMRSWHVLAEHHETWQGRCTKHMRHPETTTIPVEQAVL